MRDQSTKFYQKLDFQTFAETPIRREHKFAGNWVTSQLHPSETRGPKHEKGIVFENELTEMIVTLFDIPGDTYVLSNDEDIWMLWLLVGCPDGATR